MDKLKEGVNDNRNSTWFKISTSLTKNGFDYDEIINILDEYFEPERNFTRREWETALKSGWSKNTE